MVLDDPGGIVAEPMDQLGVGQRLAIELGIGQTGLTDRSDLIREPRLGDCVKARSLFKIYS